MKPTEITYSESHESYSPDTGLKRWKKFGITGELVPGEDIELAANELEKLVRDRLGKGDDTPFINSMPVLHVDKSGKADLASHIMTCTSIGILETYKLLVRGNPDLQETYDKKFAELNG